MRRTEYIKKLALKSSALRNRASSGIPFEEAKRLREEQDKIYDKYLFAKKFSEAKSKKERERKNEQS